MAIFYTKCSLDSRVIRLLFFHDVDDGEYYSPERIDVVSNGSKVVAREYMVSSLRFLACCVAFVVAFVTLFLLPASSMSPFQIFAPLLIVFVLFCLSLTLATFVSVFTDRFSAFQIIVNYFCYHLGVLFTSVALPLIVIVIIFEVSAIFFARIEARLALWMSLSAWFSMFLLYIYVFAVHPVIFFHFLLGLNVYRIIALYAVFWIVLVPGVGVYFLPYEWLKLFGLMLVNLLNVVR